MTSVWLVNNGGSGGDGDEWLVKSIHATKESAELEASENKWHKDLEEWELTGSFLTDKERAAIEFFAEIHADDEPPHEFAATLRSLLERTRPDA
jgi:hypothetical protein